MREIKLLESLRHPNIVHLQEMMFEKCMCQFHGFSDYSFYIYGVRVHGSRSRRDLNAS
jgi:hypothetical protein